MHSEISSFIDEHRAKYLTHLSLMKDFFLRSGLPGLRSAYTRGERQLNKDPFKETWKIAKRVEAERAIRDGFAVADVWDIVALTVVFDYDFQCHDAELFARQKGGNIFTIITPSGEGIRSARGYYARHLVSKCIRRDCFGRLCEIQLKTVLHDAWATKTHDLSYKPIDQLDRRIQEQMELIGSMLQGVERQSEILRSLVDEQWEEDSERRAAARRALIYDLMRERIAEERPDAFRVAQTLQKDEKQWAELLPDCAEIGSVINDIELVSEINAGDAAVLATFLASLRRAPDLKSVAEHYIDKWKNSASGSKDATDSNRAMLFRAYALYVLGDIRRAIELTETTLRSGLPERGRLQQSANLAYFLAESPTASQEQWLDHKTRATSLMADVESRLRGEQSWPSWLLNTKGFVKIAFGADESEIREGIGLCRRAVELAPTDEQKAIAEHFFAFQERKAWRRLLKL